MTEHLAALSDAELLPCPFCGGDAEMRGHKAPEFWVGCPAIGCKATTEGFGSQERAARAWNTRANQLAVIGPDAVEKVARAMYAKDWEKPYHMSWHETASDMRSRYLAMAIAAIAALTGRV